MGVNEEFQKSFNQLSGDYTDGVCIAVFSDSKSICILPSIKEIPVVMGVLKAALIQVEEAYRMAVVSNASAAPRRDSIDVFMDHGGKKVN